MADVIMVRVNGISPLLMHNPQGVNPLNPIQQQIKTLTSKRAKDKTEEDMIKIADLEFEIGLYYDEEIGPYLPAEMIEANLRNGARFNRKGKTIEYAVVVEPDRIPLIYDGPRTLEALRADQSFRDVRNVGVQRSKVVRCRPRFNHWGLEFMVNYSSSLIDKETIIEALMNGGSKCAIGDNRPRYGRFQVEIAE